MMRFWAQKTVVMFTGQKQIGKCYRGTWAPGFLLFHAVEQSQGAVREREQIGVLEEPSGRRNWALCREQASQSDVPFRHTTHPLQDPATSAPGKAVPFEEEALCGLEQQSDCEMRLRPNVQTNKKSTSVGRQWEAAPAPIMMEITKGSEELFI